MRCVELRVRSALILAGFLVIVGPRTVASMPEAGSPSDSSKTVAQVLCSDIHSGVCAAGYTLTRSLHWEGRDWALAGGILAFSGGAFALEHGVRSMMQRSQSNSNSRSADIAALYGDATVMLPLAGGAYLVGLIVRDRWLRETAAMSLTAMLVSGAVSTVLKVAVGRARPFSGEGNKKFKPGTFTDEMYQSFPSGHTIVAFSASTVLARRLGTPWVTGALYALATGTAISRLYTDEHWFSDVVVGAAIAVTVSSSVESWFEENTQTDRYHLGVIPSARGVTFVFTF